MILGIVIQVILNIIIFIVLFLFLLTLQVMLVNDEPHQSEILDDTTIKTGDIIGVSYSGGFGWFVTFWTESIWSHAGIAWRDPQTSELFILESAHYHAPWEGILKVPFAKWIEFNKRCVISVSRLQINDVRTDDRSGLANRIMTEYNVFMNTKLDALNWGWTRLLRTGPYSPNMQSHYTCYELVITVLQRSEIAAKTYSCSSYFPKSVVRGELPLEPGMKYLPPVLLDISDHKKLYNEPPRCRC